MPPILLLINEQTWYDPYDGWGTSKWKRAQKMGWRANWIVKGLEKNNNYSKKDSDVVDLFDDDYYYGYQYGDPWYRFAIL